MLNAKQRVNVLRGLVTYRTSMSEFDTEEMNYLIWLVIDDLEKLATEEK
jgi:hypothetical protein